jgi:hypothetical protein
VSPTVAVGNATLSICDKILQTNNTSRNGFLFVHNDCPGLKSMVETGSYGYSVERSLRIYPRGTLVSWWSVVRGSKISAALSKDRVECNAECCNEEG